MNTAARQVEIVEVGPRDGFQSIGPFIPTATKIEIIDRLFASGIRRMETTSFVSAVAVPQLADAADVVASTKRLEGLDCQVLVPTVRHAERALAAGATHLSVVVSVSERHNLGNVRRTPMESVQDFKHLVEMLPRSVDVRLNVATAFDCPHDGRVESGATLKLIESLAAITDDVEIALCDTTGRADPSQVRSLFEQAAETFPSVRAWAFHGHDTYGLGAANSLAAWDVGINVFDAAVSGLGGCPFAPGATGNVATEDLVWMFERMAIGTGIAIGVLLDAASQVARLPGAHIGGRVRDALQARKKLERAA